jgi:SAM-dependent methyltransferase
MNHTLAETAEPEIDVDEVMAGIRQAVAQKEAEGRSSFAEASAKLFDLLARQPPASLTAALARGSSDVEPLKLQPEFVRRADDHYHVNDLLKYHDKEFIWSAYRAVLKREPDSEGFESYLAKLRSGRFSKIDVLASLRRSPEGKRKKVTIDGLTAPAAVRRLYRLPLIGYLLELAVGIARLPALIRNQRTVEGHLVAQQDLIADEINKINARFGDASTLNQLYEEQRDMAHALHEQMAALYRRQQFVLPATAGFEKIDLDDLYVSFEDQFRGSVEDVRDGLKVYLPLLKESEITSDILDLGCGRGEWLELLTEAGLHGRGVESNRAMVARGETRRLEVIESDATVYLRSLPDNSLGAVTAFHFVEHLELQELIGLLDQIYRTLKTGGLLIVETPNPKNLIVGACNFYADPTHRRPLFPETLKFILEHRGFARVRLEYLHPVEGSPFSGADDGSKALDSWFFTARDFAIIGWKE